MKLRSLVTLVCLCGTPLFAQDFVAPGNPVKFDGRRPGKGIGAAVFPTTVLGDLGPATPSLENTPIYRAQIKIRTADRDDAGQDDGVRVRLNGSNETWLDSGADDFERGQTRSYDLLQFNAAGAPVLTQLSDIQMLEISKTGSDGWCFSDIELIINGRTIYRANYPRGQWLDNSGGARLMHMIPGATLRAGTLWASYSPPSPSPVVSRAEMETRIEAIIGHFSHGKGFGLGKVYNGRAIEVARVGDRTIHVDVDLEKYINNAPNAELDVDFDVEFQSLNNEIRVVVKNVKADLHSTLYSVLLEINSIFGGTSKEQLVNYINRQLRRQLEGAMFSIPTGNLNLSVTVTDQGDVILLPQ